MPLSTVLGAQSLVQPAVCTTVTRPASPYTGQAIYDTTTASQLIWNGTAWTGTGGLQLVTTATCSSGGTAVGGVVTIGSAVSSVTVSNAFSATYDAYKIVYSGGVASGNVQMQFLLGASTTTYYNSLIYAAFATGTVQGFANNNATAWDYIGYGTADYVSFNADIVDPFAAKYTKLVNASYLALNEAGSTSGVHKTASSYTSFIFKPASGTITGGTLRVYGYQNS